MNLTPKLSVFVLTLLLLEDVSSLMCSVRKSEHSCICKRVSADFRTSIVTEADCSRIDLQKVPSQDQFAPDLNLLDLSHNAIEKLYGSTKFASKSLETLILSYNKITDIDDDFFTATPVLKNLDLSHNSLTSLDSENLFQSCKNLQSLDLSFNRIAIIHSDILSPLPQLRELNLGYNDVALGQALSNTSKFLTASLSMTPNISTLKLDNLGLRDLHNLYFVNLTNLKHLSLADNHFEEVPRVPYSVEYLDISGSDVKVLQAKHLSYHSLKTLKLERMKQLESIHEYAFYNLQALEELSIRFCHNLKVFNPLVFGILHKEMDFRLKRLSLSGNGLETLNFTYKFLFQMLDYADLSDNPWNCDCQMLWLQDVDNLKKIDDIRCSSPNALHAMKLIDIAEDTIPECYPEKYGKKSHRVIISLLIMLIIILSGLVGYLMYYNPNWYTAFSRKVGPDSPYNPTRIEED